MVKDHIFVYLFIVFDHIVQTGLSYAIFLILFLKLFLVKLKSNKSLTSLNPLRQELSGLL